MKFAFIHEEEAFPIEKKRFPVAFMCRMLEVSRSGYYAWRQRGPSERDVTDRELLCVIRETFKKYPRGCGSRTAQGALRMANHHVSRKRVVRLMTEDNLHCRLKRRFARTTNSSHQNRIAKNVLNRRFVIGKPNKVWAADITYLLTQLGWVYLAVVLDIGTRKVVGWDVSPTMEKGLVLRALNNAIVERQPEPGLIHHSDRGVQYTANDYRAALDTHGMICSMSGKGDCW